MNENETRAVLTVSLLAAFADGQKHERERSEIRRIAEGLSQSGGVHLPTLYQDVLLKRYSETRRRHPLSRDGLGLAEAIRQERELLEPIADAADLIIDTTRTSVHELRELIRQRVGARKARVTMMKSLIAAGVAVAIGSDGPMNPYLNVMFATINANNPPEAMTREQAIAAYTLGSARAEGLETQKGTISPGMLADIAVLSQDIFTAKPDALPATVSVLTLVGGKIVHEGRR